MAGCLVSGTLVLRSSVGDVFDREEALGIGLVLVPQAMLNFEQKLETDSSNWESKSNSEETVGWLWYRFKVFECFLDPEGEDDECVETLEPDCCRLVELPKLSFLVVSKIDGEVESEEGEGIFAESSFQGKSNWKSWAPRPLSGVAVDMPLPLLFPLLFPLPLPLPPTEAAAVLLVAREKSEEPSAEFLRCLAKYSKRSESLFLGSSGLYLFNSDKRLVTWLRKNLVSNSDCLLRDSRWLTFSSNSFILRSLRSRKALCAARFWAVLLSLASVSRGFLPGLRSLRLEAGFEFCSLPSPAPPPESLSMPSGELARLLLLLLLSKGRLAVLVVLIVLIPISRSVINQSGNKKMCVMVWYIRLSRTIQIHAH